MGADPYTTNPPLKDKLDDVGWAAYAGGFAAGNAEMVHALTRIKSYLDYGMFQPVQIASTVTINEAADFPKEVCATYESRCDTLIDGLARIGWDVPKPGGTMFVWAPIPEAYRHLGSLEFAKRMLAEAKVAVSPGIGFGSYGDDHVRFGLIENEHRTRQAVRGIRDMFRKDDKLAQASGGETS